jgi:OFA family oxalate/formate antiporter-like MFS transporter
VPLTSVLSAGGAWNRVFLAASIITIGAGLVAKFVLAPMRKRWVDKGVPAYSSAFDPHAAAAVKRST